MPTPSPSFQAPCLVVMRFLDAGRKRRISASTCLCSQRDERFRAVSSFSSQSLEASRPVEASHWRHDHLNAQSKSSYQSTLPNAVRLALQNFCLRTGSLVISFVGVVDHDPPRCQYYSSSGWDARRGWSGTRDKSSLRPP